MNKRILAIALIVLFVVAAVAFAADAEIRYTSTTVYVKYTGAGKKIPRVEVCVMYIDDAGKTQSTSTTFYNVGSIEQSKSFSNVGKVIGAYSTYCAVPTDD